MQTVKVSDAAMIQATLDLAELMNKNGWTVRMVIGTNTLRIHIAKVPAGCKRILFRYQAGSPVFCYFEVSSYESSLHSVTAANSGTPVGLTDDALEWLKQSRCSAAGNTCSC